MHHEWLLYDFGQATAIMMLAAPGLGRSAIGDLGRRSGPLGFPDGYFDVYLIGLGYPADRPPRLIARPDPGPFGDVVHWERWQPMRRGATQTSHLLYGSPSLGTSAERAVRGA